NKKEKLDKKSNAKIKILSKKPIAYIHNNENTLDIETIHYPDKERAAQDVPNVPEKVETPEKELTTAKMLIEQLTTEFDPEKYKDEYRTALLDLIEEKKNKDETKTVKMKAKS